MSKLVVLLPVLRTLPAVAGVFVVDNIDPAVVAVDMVVVVVLQFAYMYVVVAAWVQVVE